VLLEKMKDVGTSMVIWGTRAAQQHSHRAVDPGWGGQGCSMASPRIREVAQNCQVLPPLTLSSASLPVPHSELPRAEGQVPAFCLSCHRPSALTEPESTRKSTEIPSVRTELMAFPPCAASESEMWEGVAMFIHHLEMS
jgi:hypothetical protein